jgi:hypothetical protein
VEFWLGSVISGSSSVCTRRALACADRAQADLGIKTQLSDVNIQILQSLVDEPYL